jgi:hypothetical protein
MKVLRPSTRILNCRAAPICCGKWGSAAAALVDWRRPYKGLIKQRKNFAGSCDERMQHLSADAERARAHIERVLFASLSESQEAAERGSGAPRAERKP